MQQLLMFLGGVMGQGRERNRLRSCRHLLLEQQQEWKTHRGNILKLCVGGTCTKYFVNRISAYTSHTLLGKFTPEQRLSTFFFPLASCLAYVIKVRQQHGIQVLTKLIVLQTLPQWDKTRHFHFTQMYLLKILSLVCLLGQPPLLVSS